MTRGRKLADDSRGSAERGCAWRATLTGLGESGKLEQRRLTCGRRIDEGDAAAGVVSVLSRPGRLLTGTTARFMLHASRFTMGSLCTATGERPRGSGALRGLALRGWVQSFRRLEAWQAKRIMAGDTCKKGRPAQASRAIWYR